VRLSKGLGLITLLVIIGLTTAQAQSLPQRVVGAPAPLLANPGFDAGNGAGMPIGWAVSGPQGSAAVINRQADRTAGLASLQVTDAAGSSVAVRSEKVVATPGREYTLTIKAKTGSGTPAALYLEFWDFTGARVGVVQTQPETSTQWQTVTLSADAPATAAHVTALIYGTQAAAGVSYWDEAELIMEPAAYRPELSSARELFLDDYRIESAHDVGRVVHPATTTADPVIRADQPWEDSAYIYGSVIKVGSTYRMWYTCYNDQPPNYHLCYAESTDLEQWTKPLGRGSIGYGELPASKTNIVATWSGTVAYNPEAPADRRYVMLTFRSGTVNDTLGYYTRFSADGYTWSEVGAKPVLLDGDVSNLSWDPVSKRYVATIKKRMFTARTPGTYERSAFVSTSPDAITWTAPTLAVSGDYADDGRAEQLGGLESQVYGMPVMRYESGYVGFPWMFALTDFTSGEHKAAADGPVEVQVASSRDLTEWHRPVRDPVIKTGQPGSWNDGAHYTASTLHVTPETVSLFYGAFNNEHGGADPNDANRDQHIGQIGKATWRRDGWVSLTNGAAGGTGDPGQVITKPIVIDGARLHLNAEVRPRGSIVVEVLDAEGTVIDGFGRTDAVPVRGDQLDAVLTWRSGKTLKSLSGQPIKLRISIENADLYSFWITP
jgi:hypothetical protein